MRVLFLTSVGAVDMEDYAYAALVEVLGRENVIDYPWKPEFHYHDLSAAQQDYLYRHPRSIVGYHPSRGPVNFPHLDGLFRSGPPLRDLYDAVILGAHRADSCAAFHCLREIRSPFPPVILLDGEEHYSNPWEAEPQYNVQSYVQWIFKQVYLSSSKWDRVSVLPCPCQFDLYQLYEIPTSGLSGYPEGGVFFIGNKSGPQQGQFRIECCEALEKSGLPFYGGILKIPHIHYPDYLMAIRNHRINLSMGGAVYSTRRYWEIPAVGGFMLAERPLVDQGPHDFQEGVHCDFFSTPQELVEKCRYWLDRPQETFAIAQAGNAHARQYHTLSARGEIIVEKIKELNHV